MVQTALNEFDQVDLDASVRRVVRIANLLGDTSVAVRMAMDLRPIGNNKATTQAMTLRLMPSGADEAERAVHSEMLEQYIADRRLDDDCVLSHSVAEFRYTEENQIPLAEIPTGRLAEEIATRMKTNAMVERIRHHAFTLLCSWERQLAFTVAQHSALDGISHQVDHLLDDKAPDVLDKFNVAFRRLREAAANDSQNEASEQLAQATTSCRRILKAVVDVVSPVDQDNLTSEDGHALTDDKYRNRLMQYIKSATGSESFQTALQGGVNTLFERFTAIDTLTNKGVHADIAFREAEYCALNTYVLAAEILGLRGLGSGGSAARS